MAPDRPSSSETASLSRRGLLLLGGSAMVSAVSACSGGDPKKPATASTTSQQLHLDFESRSLGRPITHHVGATISPAFSQGGRYGCRLEPLPSNHERAALAIDGTGFAQDKPWAAVSISFRLVTLPKPSDAYMNLFEIGNTATAYPKSQFTVYFKHDTVVCDFNASESMQITTMPVVGAWHRFDVVVGYGASTYTARVRFDGGAVKELVSKDNKTAQSVRSLWIHYPTVPVDYTMDVDDVRMVTSSTRPDFLPAR